MKRIDNLIDWFKNLIWVACPNCENWTTENINYWYPEINDKHLFHCYHCGIDFRRK